jgi:hypothetical protein
MIITKEIRKKLRPLLPVNYRKIVADRCDCHPNTVSNVLFNGTDNPEVALALLELGRENIPDKEHEHETRKKAAQIAKQL